MKNFILEIRNREELDLMYEKYDEGDECQKNDILEKTFEYPTYFRIESEKIMGTNILSSRSENVKNGYKFYTEKYPYYPIITFDNLGISSVNISNEDELLLLL